MKPDILDIHVIGHGLTATLERDRNGEFLFTYRTDARTEISLTMPLKDTPDHFQRLPPVLETSLPEGALLEAIFEKLGKGIRLTDDFGILKLVGRNLVGRLAVVLSGEPIDPPDPFPANEHLLHILRSHNSRELVTRAMVGLAERTGLSGVLPKTFAMSSERETRVAIPAGKYILKTESQEYPGICVVEEVCMTACRKAGLGVPETILSDDGKSLLVKRFDLGEEGDRYGFEDFCALSGRSRKEKYDSSYEAVIKILSLFSTEPKKDIRIFFRFFALMHLLKNGDAHLKNFGMLYPSRENVRLSPVYDMVSTTPFLRKDTPALTCAGKRSWLGTRKLVVFGIEQCGLTENEALSSVRECMEGIGETIPFLRDLYSRHPSESVARTLRIFEVSSKPERLSLSFSGHRNSKKGT